MRKNQLVRVKEQVSGYPTVLIPDTYCRIKEIRKNIVILVRHDNRQGEWRTSKNNIKEF